MTDPERISDTNNYRDKAISEAHAKLELAASMDRALARVDAEGSRRYLKHIDETDSELPRQHVRLALQPQVYGRIISNVQRLIVRVPMRPPEAASETVRTQQFLRIAAGAQPAESAYLPTNDIFGQVITTMGEQHSFLLTAGGLRAYESPADVALSSFEVMETGQFYDVEPSLNTAAAQVRLDSALSLFDLPAILHEYEPLAQGGSMMRQTDVA